MNPPIIWPLSKIQSRVKRGVQRSDIENDSNGYADFINSACLWYQLKRSYIFMREDVELTIPSGQSSVALPNDFKELQPRIAGGSPVNYVLNDPSNPGALFPVAVSEEQHEIKRLTLFSGQISPELRIFMKLQGYGQNNIIGTNIPPTQDLTFRVSYYGILPSLVLSGDHNPMTDFFSDMIVAKAKALALADINDPIVAALESFAEAKFKETTTFEARADLVGRPLHM